MIKKFKDFLNERKVFSEDVEYQQVFKPSKITDYDKSTLNKLEFKLDDIVKLKDHNYNPWIDDKFFIIKCIDLDNPLYQFRLLKVFLDSDNNIISKFNDEDDIWVPDYKIKKVSDEEFKNAISEGYEKFNEKNKYS